jgi:protein TonB
MTRLRNRTWASGNQQSRLLAPAVFLGCSLACHLVLLSWSFPSGGEAERSSRHQAKEGTFRLFQVRSTAPLTAGAKPPLKARAEAEKEIVTERSVPGEARPEKKTPPNLAEISRPDRSATPAGRGEIKATIPTPKTAPAPASQPSEAARPEENPLPAVADKKAPGAERAEVSSASVGSGIDRPARPLVSLNRPPVYPRAAELNSWSGEVLLDLQVSARGRVDSLRIQSSSGFPLLDQAAVNAVRHWRFVPARRNGMNVPSSLSLPVQFHLNR